MRVWGYGNNGFWVAPIGADANRTVTTKVTKPHEGPRKIFQHREHRRSEGTEVTVINGTTSESSGACN